MDERPKKGIDALKEGFKIRYPDLTDDQLNRVISRYLSDASKVLEEGGSLVAIKPGNPGSKPADDTYWIGAQITELGLEDLIDEQD